MDLLIYVHLVLLISSMMALHNTCGVSEAYNCFDMFNTYEGVIECVSQLLSVSNQSSVIVEQLPEFIWIE